MSRRAIAALVAASALALAGACGGSKAKEVAGATSAARDDASATTTVPAASSGGEAGGGAPATTVAPSKPGPAGSTGSGSATSPTTNAGPAPTTKSGKPKIERTADSTPGFPLEVTVTPDCVERGQTAVVKVVTRPYAAIGAAIKWAESDTPPPTTIGAAGPVDGAWTWNVPVTQDVKDGEAILVVSAGDRSPESNSESASSSGEQAAMRYRFQVGSSC